MKVCNECFKLLTAIFTIKMCIFVLGGRLLMTSQYDGEGVKDFVTTVLRP